MQPSLPVIRKRSSTAGSVGERRRRRQVASTAVDAIDVDGLEKRYGDVHAVDGVSFAVARGETFGILGPNGAGKTTTLEMIEGLTRPDAGSIEILGEPVWPNPTRVQGRIGVQLQKNAMFENLTAAELLDLFAPLLRRAARGPRAAAARARRPRGEGRLAGAAALGRPAAAARDRARARARPRDRVPRRADDRARPAGAPQPLGGDPRRRGREPHGRADDALPRRGRDAVRSRRDHGRRAHHRARLAAGADRRPARPLARGLRGRRARRGRRSPALDGVQTRDERRRRLRADVDGAAAHAARPGRAGRGARASRCAASSVRQPTLEDVFLDATGTEFRE